MRLSYGSDQIFSLFSTTLVKSRNNHFRRVLLTIGEEGLSKNPRLKEMDHARISFFSLPRTVFTLLCVDYLSGNPLSGIFLKRVLVSLREEVLNLVFSQKKAKEKGVLVSIEGASLHKRRRRRKSSTELNK
ncbi:uncharacterized protein LOC143854199 isoform X2 [Tasmannia lanceolata]|uniref:uncharacterized protein LOC143854199 isoform X2 n=1 Tax=Tasmannia lanceolata TaxID=3420 RepID=UPI00406283A1